MSVKNLVGETVPAAMRMRRMSPGSSSSPSLVSKGDPADFESVFGREAPIGVTGLLLAPPASESTSTKANRAEPSALAEN